MFPYSRISGVCITKQKKKKKKEGEGGIRVSDVGGGLGGGGGARVRVRSFQLVAFSSLDFILYELKAIRN